MTYQIQSTFSENFKILTNTNIAKQALTESFEPATGSEIDYVPAPGASFVIYQYSVHLFYDGSSSNRKNATFKLEYSDDNGSSWSDWGDNTEIFIHSQGSNLILKSAVDIKFCLNTTSWNNFKKLRLSVLEDSSDCALHQFSVDFKDETTNGYANQRYFPTVSCTSMD